MAANMFGELLRKHRLAAGTTLRDFCLKNKLDPGNYSRLERGMFAAPQKPELIERYAVALGLKPGSDEWLDFFDVAAASRGELPRDLLDDEELLGKLPLLFRTLRGGQVESRKLDELIDRIRRS